MRNNIHRLTEDWRMYFCGTYIFAEFEGRYRTMFVDDVVRTGDDTKLEGMEFVGTSYDAEGNEYHNRWPADIRLEFRPISGYYELGTNGAKIWVTYNVPNRTQKKGVDARNVLLGGTPGCRSDKLVKIFTQAQGFISKPGSRDFYILTSGVVRWKGVEVGRMNGNEFVANDHHKNKEALLWRLLQNS